MYRKNTAGQFFAFQGVDAATGGIKSGVTWTVRRCIDGTFAAATGTATEDSTNGWYKFAMSQADTNGNNCQFNMTGTGAVPQTVNTIMTAADPTDSVRFGLTGLANAAAGGTGGLPIVGTGANNFKSDSSANVTYANAAPPTAAAIATGVWQDTTAGDFTTAASIGKSIMNGVALGTGLTVNDITTKTGFSLSGSQTFNLTGSITGSLSGSVGSVTGAVGSVTGAVGSVTGNVGGNLIGTTADFTTAMTESYRANGATGSPAQVLYEILGNIVEQNNSGTTRTVKKLDHSTTAATYTYDSSTPNNIARAT